MTPPENSDNSQDPLRLLKEIAANAPIGIQIFDAAGYSIFTNDQHTRIFGGPPPAEKCVLRDEHARANGTLHLIEKAFAGEPTVHPLFWYDPRALTQLSAEAKEYTKKVGKRAAIETHMIPVFGPDGKVMNVVFFHKDVTSEQFVKQERERALKERDDANTLIRRVLDKTQAVIYIKALDGKYLFANGQFCRIFDMTEDQVLGKTDYDFFSKELADGFRRNDLRALETQSHIEIEEIAAHADGTEHTYLSLKFPLFDSVGVLYAVCGISTDITQRRLLEHQLNAAKRMETVGLLVGSIAHDFGNILNVMLLHAELLLQSHAESAPELRKSLEMIKGEAQKAALLIRQLLAFGRKRQVETRVIDINSILFGMRSLLTGAMGEDIRFELDAAPSVWPVAADPFHIEQILTNLCLNARDAMPKGGTPRISTSNIHLGDDSPHWHIGQPRGEYVELRVCDSGTGIPPEILNRIFEPFFSTKHDGQGTGLGLASVSGLVESNGGSIRVESKPGAGTTFYVCFPRASLASSSAENAMASEAASVGGTQTILLVEDQATLREMTAIILKAAGYKVIEASDGFGGLKLWCETEIAIDVIVTDVIMPGMNGADMIRQMSAVRPLRNTRVLFVSGYSEKQLSAHDFKQDSLHFLEKPYSGEDILRKLRAVLKS